LGGGEENKTLLLVSFVTTDIDDYESTNEIILGSISKEVKGAR